MTDRFVCIHGHFYQPPRENPWLEEIELQDSAYPYHDWNEKITAECYASNSASRVLDGEGRILRIVNNYSNISFDFGPTLLHWMKDGAPEIYAAVLHADQESRKNFSGRGSALAQAYNHMILPLANRRDKYTQVWWGIRDFESRFGRAPEGMWLPETAVDLDTLGILAELGIRFTILSPYQASRVRPAGTRNWSDVSGGRVDPSMPYRVNLRSGRTIDLFFYDGPISRAVAFEKLLTRGEDLAERMATAFSEARSWPQLVHIATDGETYGHHHPHGDMGLAYALQYIKDKGLARLTNYAEFLEQHPPTQEAQIFENSSWSCPHGVERWKSNCGCCSGGHSGWTQEWRAPLRAAFDWLRDALAPVYADRARKYLRDPWQARNAYISVVLDRSSDNIERFFSQQARRPLTELESTKVLEMLELQRHCMLMYTSCGWFFDELSGIETVQVIQYAARAIQLAGRVLGRSLEREFLERIEHAKSNIPEHRDGRHIYETMVRPARIDLTKVSAHYAVRSLFEKYPERSRIYCYEVEQEDYQPLVAGKARFVLGRVRVVSEITRDSARISFGVLHLGEHNVAGGIRPFHDEESYQELVQSLTEMFNRGDLPGVVHGIYQHFDAANYSLRRLFRDEQRRILREILEANLARAEASYRLLYETDAPLVYFIRSLNMPVPNRFRMAADFVVNTDLRREFESNSPDLEKCKLLLEEVARIGAALDQQTLEFALRRTIERMARSFGRDPTTIEGLEKLNGMVALARSLPFPVELWTAENIYYAISRSLCPERKEAARKGDEQAKEWVALFESLGANLRMRMCE